MPSLRKARAIRPGAVVGIAAPAGAGRPRQRLEQGEKRCARLGFEPSPPRRHPARDGYLAGDDARRARRAAGARARPGVDAIVCARGGYGCHRIMDRLDAGRVRAPRPSRWSATATSPTLLLWQRRCAGLSGVHGPMLERGREATAESTHSLQWLTGAGPVQRLARTAAGRGWSKDGSSAVRSPGGREPRHALGDRYPRRDPAARGDGRAALSHRSHAPAAHAPRESSRQSWASASAPSPTARTSAIPTSASRSCWPRSSTPLGVPCVSELPFGHGATNLAVAGRRRARRSTLIAARSSCWNLRRSARAARREPVSPRMKRSLIERKRRKVERALDKAIEAAEIPGAVVLARMPREGELLEHGRARATPCCAPERSPMRARHDLRPGVADQADRHDDGALMLLVERRPLDLDDPRREGPARLRRSRQGGRHACATCSRTPPG